MKKYISFSLVLFCILGLFGCGPQGTMPQEEEVDVNGQDYFNGKILEIADTYILVECLELTSGAISAGTVAKVSTDVVIAVGIPELAVDDNVRVVFTGVKETDPVSFNTVFAIYLLDEYGETLPIEQPKDPDEDVDHNQGKAIECEGFPNWGLILSVKNITSTGITLVVTQSGGEPTGSLQTGDPYRLITLVDGIWETVEELPSGTYRLIKEFMDFRKTADYDTFEYWVEFEIR